MSGLSEANGGEPPAPSRSSSQPTSPGFIELDALRDAHGLVAIISQRRNNGAMTLGVFKEFQRDGRTERTAFIPEVLFDAYESLVKLARERIAKIQADGLAPLPTAPIASSAAHGRR